MLRMGTERAFPGEWWAGQERSLGTCEVPNQNPEPARPGTCAGALWSGFEENYEVSCWARSGSTRGLNCRWALGGGVKERHSVYEKGCTGTVVLYESCSDYT